MAGSITPTSWARQLLSDLGEPTTQGNVDAVVSWEAAEGGAGPQWGIPNNTADYNPLNATQPEPGSHTVSSGPAAAAGVQAYPSWQAGLAATEQTLTAGNDGYPAILSALHAGNDPSAVAQAVAASSWGTAPFGVGNASGYNPSAPATSGGGGGGFSPSDLLPWNWGSDLANTIVAPLVSWGARLTITVFGLALVAVGADRALTGGKGATTVKELLPGAAGGGAADAAVLA